MGYFSPIIKSYLKEYAVSARGSLLDVGCGSAPYKSLFYGISLYFGLDRPSEPYVNYSQNNERNIAISAIGDAHEIPFKSDCFDIVLGLQVLEHLAEPLLFLKEARRVLVSGGEIVLTFPLINPVHEAPYDYFRYTEYGLKHLCEITDLQVIEVKPMGGGWLTVGYIIRSLLLWNEHNNYPPWWRKRLAHHLYSLFARYDCNHLCHEWTMNYFALLRKP